MANKVCKFANCLHHDDRSIPEGEEVRAGSVYYHRDCYEEKEKIAEIIDYFAKEINPNVVFAELRRTINNIVFPKKGKRIPADQLLYQLKYYQSHGGRIQYPGGIYYAVQDRNSYSSYMKSKSEDVIKGADFSIEEEDLTRSQLKRVRIQKQKGFEDIIKH